MHQHRLKGRQPAARIFAVEWVVVFVLNFELLDLSRLFVVGRKDKLLELQQSLELVGVDVNLRIAVRFGFVEARRGMFEHQARPRLFEPSAGVHERGEAVVALGVFRPQHGEIPQLDGNPQHADHLLAVDAVAPAPHRHGKGQRQPVIDVAIHVRAMWLVDGVASAG